MSAPPVDQVDSSELGESGLDFSDSRKAKKEHDKIVAWVKGQYKTIRNARSVTERQWYYNLAFYYGKQNVAWVRGQTSGAGVGLNTKLYTPPAPYWRSRPVINRIRPTIRHEISQLTNNKPNASITPASSDDRDMYAAMAGEQIWESIYIEKKFKHVLRRALWWNQVCGNGFIKAYWDESEGAQGEVCFTPETPFHVLVPDFREEELENQPFLLHAQVKSPDWVKMHWQKALDGSNLSTADTEGQDILEDSFLNLVGTQAINKQNSVLVLEAWIKPGAVPMFPEGAFFTLVGDKIVQGQSGWPYSHGKYPFAKFDHIPSGKFYSTSSVEDLIPLQKEFNRTRGQIIEAKNRMAKPQLMAPRGSVVASKITSEPGQLIEYTPGFEPPRPIPLTALPNYVTQELERIIADWNDISGQHEVSKGGVPPGVTAATAISYLQERDESQMSPTFDSMEEGIEKLANMALSYVHDYWDTERMVKMTGPGGSFDVMAFKGSELGDNIDVRIEAGSSLPVSKAAKQALIMDLMKMGFIDPQKGLEVMDMGGINKIYEQIQVDVRQVQRENLRMSKVTPQMLIEWEQTQTAAAQQKQLMESQANAEMQPQLADPNIADQLSASPVDPMTGMPAPVEIPLIISVNTWDNHKIHIEQHNAYRKGQAFENLSEEVKALFESHVMAHIKAMGEEMITMNPQAAAGLPMDMPLGDETQNVSADNSMQQEKGAPPPQGGPDAQQDPGMQMPPMGGQ